MKWFHQNMTSNKLIYNVFGRSIEGRSVMFSLRDGGHVRSTSLDAISVMQDRRMRGDLQEWLGLFHEIRLTWVFRFWMIWKSTGRLERISLEEFRDKTGMSFGACFASLEAGFPGRGSDVQGVPGVR